MKFLNHTWVKCAQLNQIKTELTEKKAQMSAALAFVKAITQGNLDAGLQTAADNGIKNELSASLVGMRDQMKKISAEEKQRHWVTEGLATFGEILRQKNNSLSILADTIICTLVKYMGANQGALYLINEEKLTDIFIEMKACYAYGRKKTLNQRIEMGQGLTGQVANEKSTLYMTSIPQDYVKITSGLGEALPRNLLIVPLKLEEKVFGLVELASFQLIQPHQIEFVERLGESIASTIASVKINEKTNLLLQETQIQAERMRAQEEEMRQNMEELTATQEEMHRVLSEVQTQERYMNELIDSSSDSILVIDKSYKVISANKTLRNTYAALGIDIVKGLDVSKLFEGTDWPKYKAYYDRTFAGEAFERTELFESHGFKLYFLSQHTPIRDDAGNVLASAVFAKDVTELVKAKKSAEELASEQQQKNEELKAQEEELRQNMEELSATQDEMQRIILEVQNKEMYLTEIINASTDSIWTIDLQCKLLSFNKKFAEVFAARNVSVVKGMDLVEVLQESERGEQRIIYDRVLEGESFEILQTFTFEGVDVHILVSYNPLRNDRGVVTGAALYAKDISMMVGARKQTEQLMKELQLKDEAFEMLEEKFRVAMDELERLKKQAELPASRKRVIHKKVHSSNGVS